MTAPGRPVAYTEVPPEEMTYEEYLAAQVAIIAALGVLLLTLSVPYQAPRLDLRRWLNLLTVMFPFVDDARRRSADLARRFYDSERAKHVEPIDVPGFDDRYVINGPDGRPIDIADNSGITHRLYERFPVDLPPYFPEWFVENLDAAREEMAHENASDAVVARLVSIALKEVEQGGRKAILRAVDRDPQVIGWARVEGTENVGSCGFCAMLISRGPVYKDDPSNAGLSVGDEATAVEIFRRAEESGSDAALMELMNRWHDNCDCKVVPVFNRASWPGRVQYENFEDLWSSVTKGLSGKDALNAFRRAIESGETGEGLRPRRRTAA